MAEIFKQINDVSKKISPITKGRKNQAQGYQFRGVDDVMNELSPILSEVGIFVLPEVTSMVREERAGKNGGTILETLATIKFKFVSAIDGSQVEAIVIGEGMDSGDKASNKAMSVAYKYACLQVFCIPTEDSKDPEDASPEPSHKKVTPKSKIPSESPHDVAMSDTLANEISLSTDLIADYIKNGLITKEEIVSIVNSYGVTKFAMVPNIEKLDSIMKDINNIVFNNKGGK